MVYYIQRCSVATTLLAEHTRGRIGRVATTTSNARRQLATSAQKRKWKQQQQQQESQGGKSPKFAKYEKDSALEWKENTNTNSQRNKADDADWNPFLFLGVFPVVMTGLFVMIRKDLREDFARLGKSISTSWEGKSQDHHPKTPVVESGREN